MGAVLREASAAQQILNESTIIGTAVTEATTTATEGEFAAKLMSKAASLGEKDATVGLIATKLVEAQTKGIVNAASILEIEKETGVSAAKIADIAATMGLTVANQGLLASLLPLLAAAGPFILAFAAIGGILAAIVYSVIKADEHFHEFDIAVENAGKKVDEANTYLKEAKEEISEVSSALEKIKSSDDAFDGLQQGTLE